jgi:hypothetical protein
LESQSNLELLFAIRLTYFVNTKPVDFGDSVARQQAAAEQGASKLAHSKPRLWNANARSCLGEK